MRFTGRHLQRRASKLRRAGVVKGLLLCASVLFAYAVVQTPSLGVSYAGAAALVLAAVGIGLGLRQSEKERDLAQLAAAAPGAQGLPTLIDQAYTRFTWGGNQIAEGDIVLIDEVERSLSRLTRPSIDFDSASQVKLACVIKSFFWIGASNDPEVFEKIAGLARYLFLSATYQPALEIVRGLETRRAWMGYQRSYQKTFSEVRRLALDAERRKIYEWTGRPSMRNNSTAERTD